MGGLRKMEIMARRPRKKGKRLLLFTIIALGALLLTGAVTVRSNVAHSKTEKDMEKEKILGILAKLSGDLPEKHRSSWEAKYQADPYFYLSINASMLK